MTPEKFTPEKFAISLLAAFDRCTAHAPITSKFPGLTIGDAYRIARLNVAARVARKETIVGWKIGFTNRTIWDEYDVHAPIWGPMYSSSVRPCSEAGKCSEWPIAHLHEPRIEPEIAFRFCKAPSPDMDEAALLTCIDAATHGFEIVQSPYLEWRFKPADTVAAGALHGNFIHGPWVSINAGSRSEWLRNLTEFSVTLLSSEGVVDVGTGRNVLDSPLSALRHFLVGLSEIGDDRGVQPGDIVTTGTVTRAFPVKAGQEWWTEIVGLPLSAMHIRCT